MLVLKALIRLAERVTLSKFGASEKSSAVHQQAKTEDISSEHTVKLRLNIVERLPHHELETIVCHDLCFTRVVMDSNWVIRH